MRKFIFTFMFILSSFISFANNDTINNIDTIKINMDKLLKAIIKVESGGNAHAISPDSSCIGILQIKTIVVDDCNEYLKMKGKTPKYTYQDRYNAKKSIEMFYLIQERYANFKPERSSSKIEHIIRLWNGGCGYRIKSTQKYYETVMSIYKK